jgi:hypothetical protein
MKFSHAKLKIVLALASACSHTSSPVAVISPNDPIANYKFARFARLSLSELQSLEVKQPFDDSVKWALGRMQFCSGQVALAFENWITIARFSNDKDFVDRARTALRDAKENREKVFESLECPGSPG